MSDDVQSREDTRGIPIEEVGVKNFRYPIVVLDRDHHVQNTIGDFDLRVSLPKHYKGAHMSRFPRTLVKHIHEINQEGLKNLADDLKKTLKSESVFIKVTFPYHIRKPAPVTHIHAEQVYDCGFIYQGNGDSSDFWIHIEIPVSTVCPCSLELTGGKSAHNQRGKLTIEVNTDEFIWIEDIVDMCDEVTNPVHPILKRPDEKEVTLAMFRRPQFVEDVVRDVYVRLKQDKRIKHCVITSENFESIHPHNVIAKVSW